MGLWLLLLFSLVWVMGLVNLLFSFFGNEIFGCDIILVLGGFFFIVKLIYEIYVSFEVIEVLIMEVVVFGFFLILV